MKLLATRPRTSLSVITLLVMGALLSAPVSSQLPEDDCEYGKLTKQERKDGSVWFCFETLECDDGDITAEDICFKMI